MRCRPPWTEAAREYIERSKQKRFRIGETAVAEWMDVDWEDKTISVRFKPKGAIRIRTPADFGGLIRDYRTKLGFDQKSLAQKVGVSRQWIVDVEKGKAGAPIGLLLRTIGALGIALDAEKENPTKPIDKSLSSSAEAPVDIDSIVDSARRKRK